MYKNIAEVKSLATEKMQAATDDVKNTFTNQFDKMRSGMNDK